MHHSVYSVLWKDFPECTYFYICKNTNFLGKCMEGFSFALQFPPLKGLLKGPPRSDPRINESTNPESTNPESPNPRIHESTNPRTLKSPYFAHSLLLLKYLGWTTSRPKDSPSSLVRLAWWAPWARKIARE